MTLTHSPLTLPQHRQVRSHLFILTNYPLSGPPTPRIPSVESRRAWAHARGLNPTHVHRWFSRRRAVAKKLKIKIPDEMYELPVGNPPVVPVAIKDEPAEPEIPAPTAPTKRTRKKITTIEVSNPSKKQSKKKAKDDDSEASSSSAPKDLKRKRDELSNDNGPESVTQPKNKKKKLAGNTATNAKQSRTTVQIEPDVAEEPAPSAPTMKSKRKLKKTDIELPAENPAPTKTVSKRKRNAQTDSTSDDVPETATQPKKKAKTVTVESSAETTVEPDTPVIRRSRKKTVRFDSPTSSAPPASSPTLYASSPPPSDAPTVVDDSLSSSPLSKSSNERGLTAKARTLQLAQAGTGNRSAKENRAPLKSALKMTKAPKKRTAKVAVTAAVPEEEEEEEVLLCDQGKGLAPTGFTCPLCAPTPDDDRDATEAPDGSEPQERFDWHFGFSPFSGPLDDYTGVSVDVTPLSAIPFLAAPSAFLAPVTPELPLDSLTYEADGYIEIDGQKFTYDGMAVIEEGGGEFFPVLPTVNEWKALADGRLLMDSGGNWGRPDIEVRDEDAEGEVDVDIEGMGVVASAPAGAAGDKDAEGEVTVDLKDIDVAAVRISNEDSWGLEDVEGLEDTFALRLPPYHFSDEEDEDED
ncbi:hypothetical protein MVEN_00414900 [Mycena venus]|uniref:Homeobox domain-containing protein n=1 Tax=Mycena venus TaxID=2733690 RepID=A0A8H6YW56_9AGAR|nr:hypothetical protein MVEN_00414900 [Mycena venus]